MLAPGDGSNRQVLSQHKQMPPSTRVICVPSARNAFPSRVRSRNARGHSEPVVMGVSGSDFRTSELLPIGNRRAVNGRVIVERIPHGKPKKVRRCRFTSDVCGQCRQCHDHCCRSVLRRHVNCGRERSGCRVKPTTDPGARWLRSGVLRVCGPVRNPELHLGSADAEAPDQAPLGNSRTTPGRYDRWLLQSHPGIGSPLAAQTRLPQR